MDRQLTFLARHKNLSWIQGLHEMRKTRGLFIVLEGIDGSGTTTQAKKLHNYLCGKGLDATATNEPTDEPVGKLIRDSLSGRITSPRTSQRIEFSEPALCLLFAADRVEHSRLIDDERRQGVHVVCDRYVLSSIAYQSLDPSITPQRVIDVNRGCSVPDVTFFLQVPVSECLARLKNRKDAPTVYETKGMLKRIDRNYRTMRKLYERTYGPIIVIDGSVSPDDVHAEIVERLARHLPR
jgi:dTMP kinase